MQKQYKTLNPNSNKQLHINVSNTKHKKYPYNNQAMLYNRTKKGHKFPTSIKHSLHHPWLSNQASESGAFLWSQANKKKKNHPSLKRWLRDKFLC